MNRITWMVLALLCVGAGEAGAQTRQLSLEANPIHGTLGYGRVRSPTLVAGVQIGFGFPQLDRTLVPDRDDDFLDIAHIGLFVRTQPSRRVALDGRVQLGIAEYTGCSGCFPGVFAGISGGAFFGGRNIKIGPRITTGVHNDLNDPAEWIVNLTPVALLFTVDW
jgi:hypothetical protein